MIDIKKAEELNAKAVKLNNLRQQQKGALDSAVAQLQKAIADYNAKYGTNLTLENLSKEYEMVSSQLRNSMQQLSEQIEYIESGKYKENANNTSGNNINGFTQGIGVAVQNIPANADITMQGAPVNGTVTNVSVQEDVSDMDVQIENGVDVQMQNNADVVIDNTAIISDEDSDEDVLHINWGTVDTNTSFNSMLKKKFNKI